MRLLLLFILLSCAYSSYCRTLGDEDVIQEIVDECYAYLQSHEMIGTKWAPFLITYE